MFSSFGKSTESRRNNTTAICDIKKPKPTTATTCDKKCNLDHRPTKGEDTSDVSSIFRK